MASVRVRQLLYGSTVTSVLVANFFLFLPLTLFIGNEKEFSVTFNSILRAYAGPAIAVVAIVALLSTLLPARMFRVLVAIIGIVSLLVWIQANMFVWDYGALNGSIIDWSNNRLFGWIELAVWLPCIAFVVWKVRQVGDFIVGMAITIGVLQFGLFGYSYLSSADEIQTGADLDGEKTAASKIYQYSSTENIVHIIADGFQADILNEILTNAESAENTSDALSGFTVFPKQLGAFPYTHMSVPAILSSNVYHNHMPIPDFMTASLGDASIISLAKENGYEVDMALPRGALMDIYNKALPDHVYPVDNRGQLDHENLVEKDAALLFDLSLFRSVPHFFKKLVYNDQKWMVQSMLPNLNSKALQNFWHMDFLNESVAQMTANRDTPVYKLFHLMLSHNPMVTRADCRSAGELLLTNRENVVSQARCGLQVIITFLDAMKQSGIYDSSTIIIMGDHGAWIQPTGAKAVRNEVDGTLEMINPSITALSTPFFAVKRPGDVGQVTFSDAPSAITDTAKTIASIKNFDNAFNGSSVFDLPSGHRDRRFMYYRYRRSEWTDDYLAPIEEFRISGDAIDSGSWTPVNTYFPGDENRPAVAKSNLWQTVSADSQ